MSKMSKIYTKVGDHGQTRQLGGKMVAKDDPQISALGNVDELESYLGVVIANLSPACQPLKAELIAVQRNLYLLETDIAIQNRQAIGPAKVKDLEDRIDELTPKLPPRHEFILPGGKATGAGLQYARTVARRAERSVVKLDREEEKLGANDLKYLNRLSDYLFTLARYANVLDGYQDLKSKV